MGVFDLLCAVVCAHEEPSRITPWFRNDIPDVFGAVLGTPVKLVANLRDNRRTTVRHARLRWRSHVRFCDRSAGNPVGDSANDPNCFRSRSGSKHRTADGAVIGVMPMRWLIRIRLIRSRHR
jgi:hypothetical protein